MLGNDRYDLLRRMLLEPFVGAKNSTSRLAALPGEVTKEKRREKNVACISGGSF